MNYWYEDNINVRTNSVTITGCGGPAYNAVLKVVLSDEEAAVSDSGSSLGFLTYTASGGETSFQDDRLIGVLVYEVTKDGIEFTKIAKDATFSTTKKQYKHDDVTGEIIFPDTIPPMEPDEDSIVKYIGEGSAISGGEPVTLEEAKEWLKLSPDITEDDTLIQMLITACRIMCEKAANLSFIPRTVTATVFNGQGDINLPYGPVNGEVTYTLRDSDLTPLENFDITSGYENPFIATYSAGYSVLPKNLKKALLNQIAFSYDNRGDVALSGSISPLSKLVLDQVRVET